MLLLGSRIVGNNKYRRREINQKIFEEEVIYKDGRYEV